MFILGIALFLLLLVILFVGLVFLVQGTQKKNSMGINLAKTVCAECGAPTPAIRKPANLRQALWGGWTCAQCGTENDKWGRKIQP